MPVASSAAQSEHIPSATVTTLSTQSHSNVSMAEDNLSDAGSDVSLISVPSSADEGELWHEARSRVSSNPNTGAAASPAATAATDYVLLYDDESSDEEKK